MNDRNFFRNILIICMSTPIILWITYFLFLPSAWITFVSTGSIVFSTLAFLSGTALLATRHFSSWKKYPTGTTLTQDPVESNLIWFYSSATDKPYKNTYAIGKLYYQMYGQLENHSPNQPIISWSAVYYTGICSIIDTIHTQTWDNDWLMTVENTLNNQTYAHTYSYLKNLFDDPTFAPLLKSTPSENDTEQIEHQQLLVRLNSDLQHALNKSTAKQVKVSRTESTHLNNNSFTHIEPIVINTLLEKGIDNL